MNNPESINQQYTPIKSLNSFLTDWRIKARVTKKYPKKQWKNERTAGTLLNIELMDQYGGQITATFFHEQADKYDLELQTNKIYLFSNGTVKVANQKYTSIKNEYCINFDKNCHIELVEDDNSIKAVGFNFITISDVQDVEQNKSIDTIGVITQVLPVSQINVKAGGQKDKRNVVITDESELTVTVTLWEGLAQKEDYQEGQVLALKTVRVSDYNGRTINAGESNSQVFIDTDHPRTHKLKKWWKEIKGNMQNFNSLTSEPVQQQSASNF